MRSHLPGQSDSAGPSVVCVGGHAKKLVRLGDTKSGSSENMVTLHMRVREKGAVQQTQSHRTCT